MARFLATAPKDHLEVARDKARELIFDAWDQRTSRSRLRLAREALKVYPLCADAFTILGMQAATSDEALSLFTRGVEAAVLDLGPEAFDDYAGHFWGHLDTRPYMRARGELARVLLELGETSAAVGHYRAMLTLNPGDNQGFRYVLLAHLLRQGDDTAVKDLLAAYENEGSAFWLYTRALIAFRDLGETDRKAIGLAEESCRSNKYVPSLLARTTPVDAPTHGFIGVGQPDEAEWYVSECGTPWRKQSGAVAWLNRIGTRLPK